MTDSKSDIVRIQIEPGTTHATLLISEVGDPTQHECSRATYGKFSSEIIDFEPHALANGLVHVCRITQRGWSQLLLALLRERESTKTPVQLTRINNRITIPTALRGRARARAADLGYSLLEYVCELITIDTSPLTDPIILPTPETTTENPDAPDPTIPQA